jgi:PAS domain S-box-containing protein
MSPKNPTRPLHPLLVRQIRRLLGGADRIPPDIRPLLEAVNEAYSQNDADRALMERSLEISSRELLQSNEEMRAIFRALPDQYYRVDAQGTIREIKVPGRVLSNGEMTAMVGTPFTDLFPRAIAEIYAQAIQGVLRSQSMAELEYSLSVPGGRNYFEARLIHVLADQVIVIVRDMTERKQAELALQESEERFREIIQRSSDVISILDRDGLMSYNSPSAERMYGYFLEELQGKSPFEFIHPDDVERARIAFQSVIDGTSRGMPMECRFRKANGSWVHIEVVGSNLLDYPGIQGIVITSRDVTERKRAEETLRESEDKYRKLAETANDLIVSIDFDGIITYANQAAVEVAGGMKLVGIPLKDVIPLELVDRHKDMLEDRSQGYSSVRSYEWVLKSPTRNGDIMLVDIKSSLLTDKGEPSGVLFIARDITERKRMEEVLRENEQFLRDILNSIQDGIGVLDLHMTIRRSNEVVRHWCGKDESLAGRKCYEAYFGRSEPCDMCPTLKCLQSGRGESAILPGFPGSPVEWIEVYSFPMPDSATGKISGVVEYIRDITERKKLEAQLVQFQKLEAVGTLAGGIAHDFNNLLMGIQGYTSLLLHDMEAAAPQREKLREIEQLIKSGADLTRQLLGFARSGKFEVKPTGMNDLLEKTADMFARTKKEIVIHKSLGDDLWTVDADRGQLEQVLLNLLINAWQAMPGGGNLYLRTGNDILGESDFKPYDLNPGRFVCVEITDTGMGMDSETQRRIFEPFFTTKSMGRGTGLGLASVYGIIRNHGGFVDVSSKPGKGTTFRIFLPASEREVAVEKAVERQILTGRETILLVDDEETVLEVVRMILEKLGYRVILAGSGQEAVAVYLEKGKRIDLVILDMIMPGMGGGKTFEALREVNPDVRVILSSGYSIDGEAQSIMDKGCNGYIQKPYQIQSLSEKIREVLR